MQLHRVAQGVTRKIQHREILRVLGLLNESTAALEKGTNLVQIARRIFDHIDLRADLSAAADGGPQGEQRYKNVEHLVTWLERYEHKAAREVADLWEELKACLHVSMNEGRNESMEARKHG